jgi:hypothetical protein
VKLAAVSLVAVALAGCESTQAKSARLERDAQRSLHEKGLAIKSPSRDITVGSSVVLKDANGAAVAIQLSNHSTHTLVNVPVAFSVRGAGKKKLFANDSPGLDTSLVDAPSIAPGQTLDWVNDQVTLDNAPSDVVAEAGDAKQGPARLPQLAVTKLALGGDPAEGLSITGTVTNKSAIAQSRLVVFVVGRSGDRIVAAARAIVPKLAPGASATFSAFPIGNPRGARLEASAPATVTR